MVARRLGGHTEFFDRGADRGEVLCYSAVPGTAGLGYCSGGEIFVVSF
jgi:hypothetical protein